MDKKELKFILQEGEGQFIEFKESFDSSLAKEIIAFANVPKIDTQENYFYITFKPNSEYLKMVSKKDIIKDTAKDTLKDTVKLLSKNEKIILAEIGKEPKITSKELSVLLSINLRNAKNNISKLKQKGLLKRIGSAKGGCWKIIK